MLTTHIAWLGLRAAGALSGAIIAAAPLWTPQALAQESPKDIVATQVRAQGHPCNNPQSAQRDQAASKPDAPVWLLQCQDASYRVRLISGMAAQIERID